MSTKITLRPEIAGDDSQDVVLGDGADRTSENGVGPLQGTTTVTVRDQPFNGIRALRTQFLNRENRSGSYPFQTSKHFATMADAGRYLLVHGMTVPASGTLIFDFGDNGTLGVLFGVVLRQIGALAWNGKQVQGSYTAVYGDAALVAAADLQEAINAYCEYDVDRKINCGGDASGDWEADADYDDESETGDTTASIAGEGTVPEDVYQTWREGVWSYGIELPAGTYDVKLHFSEPSATAASARVFDVAIDGTVVLNDYDIWTEAGGAKDTAVVETIAGIEFEGGELIIAATSGTGDPLICGIEIQPHEEAE